MKKYNEYNIDDWNSSLRHQIAYQSLKNNDLSMELILIYYLESMDLCVSMIEEKMQILFGL